MHNAASAFWYENGRSTVLGSLLFVQLWIRRCFLQQVYSLRYHVCASVGGFFFLETWNKVTLREDNVKRTPRKLLEV
jgi:hypothetical protein